MLHSMIFSRDNQMRITETSVYPSHSMHRFLLFLAKSWDCIRTEFCFLFFVYGQEHKRPFQIPLPAGFFANKKGAGGAIEGKPVSVHFP